MFAHKKTLVATDRIYGFQPITRPTFDDTLAIFGPVRANIEVLRDEVMTARGYPVFVDHTGALSRIDIAMEGWAELWDELAPDLPQRAIKALCRKLKAGVLLDESELDAALAEVDRQMARFQVLEIDRLKSVGLKHQIIHAMAALKTRRAA